MLVHVGAMKKLLNLSPPWFAGSGIIAAMAMIGGFWISQMLASYFVSGAVMGTASKIAGAVFFGLFTVLFVLHLCRPWSRTAAMLGMGSFGAFTVTMAYLSGDGIAGYAPSVELLILLSAGLALLGIAVDVVRSTQLSLP